MASLDDRCGGAEDTVTFADGGRLVSISHDFLDVPERPTLSRMSDGTAIQVERQEATGWTVLDATTGLMAIRTPAGVELADDWGRSTLAALGEGVQQVAVVGERAAVAILYLDGRCELRSAQTGEVIETLGSGFNQLQVSSEAPLVWASHFVEFPEEEEPSTVRPVLWRITEGGPIRVPGDIIEARMGPPGSGVYFVGLDVERTELRRQADDSVIGVLDGVVASEFWASDHSAAFIGDFGTAIFDRPTERMTVLATPPVRLAAFGSDAGGRWLLLAHADFRTTAWELGPEPERVFLSEVGDVVMQFDETGTRFLVSGVNGTGYLVDLAWIRQTRGAAMDLSATQLIASACGGPLAEAPIDPITIEPYLHLEESACR